MKRESEKTTLTLHVVRYGDLVQYHRYPERAFEVNVFAMDEGATLISKSSSTGYTTKVTTVNSTATLNGLNQRLRDLKTPIPGLRNFRFVSATGVPLNFGDDGFKKLLEIPHLNLNLGVLALGDQYINFSNPITGETVRIVVEDPSAMVAGDAKALIADYIERELPHHNITASADIVIGCFDSYPTLLVKGKLSLCPVDKLTWRLGANFTVKYTGNVSNTKTVENVPLGYSDAVIPALTRVSPAGRTSRGSSPQRMARSSRIQV